MSGGPDETSMLEMTTDIVVAYVGKNRVSAEGLPNLIQNVHAVVRETAGRNGARSTRGVNPAAPANKSIFADYIICLEDGKRFKSLKRHLKSHYDLTPDEYRRKWRLPADYPMVAPNYARVRSQLAKKIGLGRKGKS